MVTIKGIAMPETCWDCPCIDKIAGQQGPCHCAAAKRYLAPEDEYLSRRAKWCPLVETKNTNLTIKNRYAPNPWECLHCRFGALDKEGDIKSQKFCWINKRYMRPPEWVDDRPPPGWKPDWCPIVAMPDDKGDENENGND